jgi:hypothetical protein
MELISGANVRYFESSKREEEWDLANVRMQAIMENDTISISDKLNLYKKLRLAGVVEETWLRRFVKFIYATAPTDVKTAAIRSRVSTPSKKDAKKSVKSVSKKSTGFDKESSNAKPSLHIQNSSPMDDIEDNSANNSTDDVNSGPSGQNSAPVSAALIQRLLEEAELNATGVSPFPVHQFDKNFAMGRVAPLSFMHSLLAQTYFRPYLVDVISNIASSISQLRVPDKFHGKKYSSLFVYLLQKNILPLGLYRGALRWKRFTASSGMGSMSNLGTSIPPLPYVYTNPRQFDLVDKDDMVFILNFAK